MQGLHREPGIHLAIRYRNKLILNLDYWLKLFSPVGPETRQGYRDREASKRRKCPCMCRRMCRHRRMRVTLYRKNFRTDFLDFAHNYASMSGRVFHFRTNFLDQAAHWTISSPMCSNYPGQI